MKEMEIVTATLVVSLFDIIVIDSQRAYDV